MVITIKVDIIGGGLSGLSSAITIKRIDKKIDVIVYEKHDKIGFNRDGRRCGEGYSLGEEWKSWKPIGDSIYNKIYNIKTVAKGKTYTLKLKPDMGFMLNRQAFISQLGEEAKKLGVKIKTNNKIKTINELNADYIIDASGCPSVVKKELGLKKGITGLTYQQTLENCNKFTEHSMKIVLTHDCGYYWIFPRNPKKKEVNFGFGMIGKKPDNLKQRLEKIKKEENITGKINHQTGGLIPAGIQRPLLYDNILFVGDSGVGSFPLTGEGIYRALYSGELAGRCIANGYPKNYPKEINKNFLKWDIIGKTFIKINKTLEHIGEDTVFLLWHLYLDWWYSFH